jgi:hypothetical protein
VRTEHLQLLPHQADLVEDTTSDTLIDVAGLGSGKTLGLVYKALAIAGVNGNIPTYVVEPTYPMVRKILVPTFEEVLEKHRIPYTYNRVDHLLRVRLAGKWCPIQLESSEHPDKLKGPNIGSALIDEAGMHKPDVWRHLPPRCRHPDARVRQFVAVGTPEGLNTFQEWAEGDWDERKRGTRRVIRAQTYDNLFLQPSPQEYVRTKLSHLDETDIDQYVRGLFVARGTRVYRAFQRDIHGMPAHSFSRMPIVVGADFNVGKMCWTIGVVRRDELHIIGEVIRRDATTWDQGEALTRAVQDLLARDGSPYMPIADVRRMITIHCDPSAKARSTRANRSDVEQLRDMGFEVQCNLSPIPIRDRVMTVSARLRLNRLFVDVAACPALVASLEKQGRDRNGDPEKDSDAERDLSGPVDALGYLIWGHPHWRATVPQGNRGEARIMGYV